VSRWEVENSASVSGRPVCQAGQQNGNRSKGVVLGACIALTTLAGCGRSPREDHELARAASPTGDYVATATSRSCGLAGGEAMVRVFVGRRDVPESRELLKLVGPVTATFVWPSPRELEVTVTDTFGDKARSWPEIERLLPAERSVSYDGLSIRIGTSRQLRPSSKSSM
jgi:hypothetical protein